MDINKILLIHPPTTTTKTRMSDVESFPLGLLYMATLLSRNGYDVEILDCIVEDFIVRKVDSELFQIGLSDKGIAERIKEARPDLIGISIPYSCQYYDALRVNNIAKGINRQIITVAGGSHVSAMPEAIGLRGFDYCVIGEGELPLLNLVNALRNDSTEDIPGVLSKVDARQGRLPMPKLFLEDLDSLPYPEYGILPLENYWVTGNRWVNIIASRGCPFNCNFCSVHCVMGRKLRLRSVDNIVTEIELLKQRFNLGEIRFEDDALNYNTEWAKELFRKIIGKNFRMRFRARNGLRADLVDKEMLLLMKKAGFREIVLGCESGSQNTLDKIIKKGLKLESVDKTIVAAKSVGLRVGCFLIIGFPGETKNDIAKTIEYGYKLKRLGCKPIWIFCATPYPGTRLFDECVNKGIIDRGTLDFRKLSVLDSVIFNKYFSTEELKGIRDKAWADLNNVNVIIDLLIKIFMAAKYLFLNPKSLIRKIRRAAIRFKYRKLN